MIEANPWMKMHSHALQETYKLAMVLALRPVTDFLDLLVMWNTIFEGAFICDQV